MMKKRLTIALSMAAILGTGTLRAAEPADSLGIIGRIAENPRLEVSQPAKLAARLMPVRVQKTETDADGDNASAPAATGGYRIQVFSGNNPRTARAEAHSRAAAIGVEFPEWATYVTFDSPYWRVKVGDFRSYDDGRAALSLLKKHFPAFEKEMRLVRDRIKNGN